MSQKQVINRWFYLLLLLFISPVVALAQNQVTNALVGTIVDQNAALVSNAQVTIKQGDKVLRSTVTDASGAFSFDKLKIGNYEIVITREGFTAANVPVQFSGSPLAPLKIVLPVAELQQDIAVVENSAQANTNADGNLDVVTLDRNALNNLPALDQNYVGALSQFLDAGAVGTGGVTLVVDGMEATKAGVSASAIQEVKINNNPYSAEYGRPGRGRIEIITKPGAAQYHGAFNFLFRDQHLNARDVFATTRPSEQRRIFEGNLTGPISQNKTHPSSFLFSANREEDDLQSIIFANGENGTISTNFPRPTRQTEFSLRLARQMTAQSTFSVLYSYEDQSVKNQGVGGFNLPEVATNFKNHEDLLRFSHNWILSPRLVNQLNFMLGRYDAPTTSVQQAQRIVVQDAFTSGGAQADYLRTEAHWTLNEVLTYSHGKHTIKAGVQVPDFSRRGINDRTNNIGTFYFSSLQDYLQKRPFSFIQQQGVTKVTFWEMILGGFVQDEIRLRPNVSVAVGLRYDWQNYFNEDSNNFAPRMSVAWSPDKQRKTIVRGGLGIFYDRSGPAPISEVLRFNGQRLRRYVLTNPGFSNPLSNGQTFAAQPSSLVRLAPNVVIPYTLQTSLGIERQLRKSLTLTLNYTNTCGINLFRSRDVNAPLAPLFIQRPDPTFSLVRQIESTGHQTSHALELGLRGNITPYFNGMIQYVLGRAWNDTSGISSFPANSYDLSGEWARADFDMRHRFNLLGTFKVGKYFNLGTAVTLNTGAPYTLTTGRDDNRDSLALDRPNGVGRNTLQGPGFAQLDLRWSREIYLNKAKREKGSALTVGVNALNVTNRVNFIGYVGNLSSPFFGQAVAARSSRRLQFSFQFTF